jgi:hypothetical protein
MQALTASRAQQHLGVHGEPHHAGQSLERLVSCGGPRPVLPRCHQGLWMVHSQPLKLRESASGLGSHLINVHGSTHLRSVHGLRATPDQ